MTTEELKNVIKETRLIAESWTANDGGLTWAATDLLTQASAVERFLSQGDKKGLIRWVGPDGEFNCDTGPETDLVCAALQWAWAD